MLNVDKIKTKKKYMYVNIIILMSSLIFFLFSWKDFYQFYAEITRLKNEKLKMFQKKWISEKKKRYKKKGNAFAYFFFCLVERFLPILRRDHEIKNEKLKMVQKKNE
jgi:hypothetical protein